MGTSADDLKKRYSTLSDSELIQLYRVGGLTDEATIELSEQFAIRGLTTGMVDNIIAEESNEQKQEYLTSTPRPIPKIWIGFLIAGAALIAEFYDAYIGLSREFGIRTLFLILGTVYWFFCVHRFHVILKHISLGAYAISPAAAVGFHFVPFYNFYWVFKWPITLVDFLKQKSKVQVIPGWLIGMLLLLSILVSRLFDGSIGLACIYCLFLYLASKLRQGVYRFTEA